MNAVNLVFPHQLFEESPMLENGAPVYLIEEALFFKQYAFHKQKLAFHRSTMKFYEHHLQQQDTSVHYIESTDELADIRKLLSHLASKEVTEVHYYQVNDNWLQQRIQQLASEEDLTCQKHQTPMFLNSMSELQEFFDKSGEDLFQTEFYIQQRKRRQILLEKDDKPLGGKWSYDQENRKKYPRDKKPPQVTFPQANDFYEESLVYVKEHYPDNPGHLSTEPRYPVNFKQSRQWLQQFLEERFAEFGPYEDAIVANESILNHSVLTPMLNVGLLTPQYVLDRTLKFSESHEIPLNSLEGFLRQIMGWREFIRGVYLYHGSAERTRNFWGFDRKIPGSFYEASTGIEPLDITIQKVLDTGYCHHIERLMVLGNFMLLCEFDPDEVYRWFMELFIDAYDWVMVPNVYGMSQFADGGLMATKPYISGSNYLKKMSNYSRGDWEDTWDGLFWRFMHVHREFFLNNPRLGMLVHMYDKMSSEKQQKHLDAAQDYLDSLD